LLELLLVLAILVIAAAAVAPSLRGVVRNASLKSAADTVRAALTKAHVTAMKTGRTQVFQYELNGSKYKVEPWIGDDAALEGATSEVTSSPPPPAMTSAEGLLPGEKLLPEGVKFVHGDSALAMRSQRIEEELSAMGGAGASWSRPILFYRDGSSSDAFIVVGNDFQSGIRIDLRGMTSAVKVGSLTDLQQLEQAVAVSP
jgi:hypothetical protein